MRPTRRLTKRIALPIELTETEAEAAFNNALLRHGRDLPKPKREYPIPEDLRVGTLDGYQVDFAWPDYRVIVEVEGGAHCIRSQHEKDCKRFNQLHLWGYIILRFTPKQIYDDPEAIIDTVRHLLFKGGFRHE